MRAILFAVLVSLAAQGTASAQVAATTKTGEELYKRNCATCHGDEPHLAGTSALGVKYNGQVPAALEKRTDLDPEVIKFFVRNGVSIMPHFRKTEISDADLAAITAYLTRNNK